jgi:hypothetical protein
MLKENITFWLMVLASLGLTKSVCAAVSISGDSADAVIKKDGTQLSGITGRLGASTSPFTAQQGGRVAEYVFRLPVPGPGELAAITTATLQFTILSDQADGAYNIDLYGLGARTAPAVVGGDYYAGPSDLTDATLLQDNILVAAHPNQGVETVTSSSAASAALAAYLNAQYGVDGAGAGRYVFLRLSPDTVPPNEDTGMDVAFAENSMGKPQLTVEFVPEPTSVLWIGMAIWTCRRRIRS